MKRLLSGLSAAALAVALSASLSPRVEAADAALDCEMKFDLTGWSAIYKHAEGNGTVTCENGKTMRVAISAKGGGLTVGKSEIKNGTGKFTDIRSIDDILGTYAQGEATGGVGKTGTAQILTKGDVSLALAGVGEGVDIGISFGGFTISKAK
ncbi:MAG: hypothetical protein ABI650_01785 [Dokdonella sp.]